MRAWAVITAGLLAGCASPHEVHIADTDPSGWRRAAAVAVPNTDTLARRDQTVVLRCDERFREDTLTLRIGVLSPDSLAYEEPFTLRIPRGTAAAPLGREVAIPYRRRSVLADSGTYRFTFTPVRSVAGIEAAGLSITASND